MRVRREVDWGARIKEYRSLRGITQEAFAEYFGVDRTTVSRWERGRDIPALVYRRRLMAMTLSYPESVMRGLIDHIDGLDGTATLLDGKFRVVRTSRLHQSLLKYDAAEIYGKSCERYWSSEMAEIAKAVGGLDNFRRIGVYCLDLTVVRQPGERGFANVRPLISVGRTVAVGDPRDPIAYLTTLRLADDQTARQAPVIKCLDGQF